METDDREPGGRTRSPPAQQPNDGAVEYSSCPAQDVRGRPMFEQRSDDRKVGSDREPHSQGQRMEQPIGVEFGESGEGVDDSDLKSEQPHPSPLDRPRPALNGEAGVDRRDNHQPTEQGHQPVVVQIGRGIDELNPGKPDEEHHRRRPSSIADRYRGRAEGHDGDEQVHAGASRVGHPPKPGVREVACRLGVQGIDPAVSDQADHAEHPHCTDEHANNGERGPLDEPTAKVGRYT